MANTYTQIYIHYVFATKTRIRLLRDDIQHELFSYAAGIIKEQNCFLQAIGGMEDHVHLLIGLLFLCGRSVICFGPFESGVR